MKNSSINLFSTIQLFSFAVRYCETYGAYGQKCGHVDRPSGTHHHTAAFIQKEIHCRDGEIFYDCTGKYGVLAVRTAVVIIFVLQ